MLNVNTIQSLEKPKIIEIIDKYNYIYNYNIKETQIETPNIEDSELPLEMKQGYECTPIMLKGYPNYVDCIRKLISLYISLEDELKIINEYNAEMLLDEEDRDAKVIDNYKQYLALRKEIKNNVKQDFKVWQS